MSKTIAQQLGIKDFPFIIKDKNGGVIYYESSDNTWWRRDLRGKIILSEDYGGKIRDNRPKEIITLNGIKYQRVDE